METRVHSHTRESLNKSDESRDRIRKLSEMFRLLILFDILRPRNAHFRWFQQGMGLVSPLTQTVVLKGVNSQPPVGLGLEHEAAGGESALRTAVRREPGAS